MSTAEILQLLRDYESRNITWIAPEGSWPIVWQRAQGVHVWDADGRRYLDLTAAFGVAAAGHANPRVVRAGQKQMATLLHAMGDVHPHALKALLARELSRITFERWTQARRSADGRATASAKPKPAARGRSPLRVLPPARAGAPAPTATVPPATGKTIFCNSGFEAVEAGLKTALLATGKPGVIAFHGAYHGLGYGALNATHRRHFREPFQSQLGNFGHFVPFPGGEYVAADGRSVAASDVSLDRIQWMIRQLFQQHPIGAILVEPVQGRAGIRVPPPEFLALLRRLADEQNAVLIVDEIYTGFGRTGRWFATEHSGTVPDVICLGKALTGGFPLAACVGRADLMDAAWPAATGEAIHTSTFLGHPVGCAMALAHIEEIERHHLVEHSAELGQHLLESLQALQAPWSALRLAARGVGLMAGLELATPDGSPAPAAALQVVRAMLQRGYILLPEGDAGNVVGIVPPLTITRPQLDDAVAALQSALKAEPWRVGPAPARPDKGTPAAPRGRNRPRTR